VSLTDDIEAFVKQRDYVTFVEIQNLRGRGALRGDCGLEIPGREDLVLWGGMSDELGEALDELIRAGRIHLVPASRLTYLVDGGSMRLPLAKRPMGKPYKKPHWLPCCLRPGSGKEVAAAKR